MNNRLKFRIWDNTLNKFGNPDHYSLIFRYGLIHGKERHPTYNIYYNPNVIVQQYTGLNDIEGKDIYDGDIVELHAAGNYRSFTVKINEIHGREHFGLYEVYFDRCYKLKEIKPNWFFDAIGSKNNDLHNFYICKVAGNIFENPELIKE